MTVSLPTPYRTTTCLCCFARHYVHDTTSTTRPDVKPLICSRAISHTSPRCATSTHTSARSRRMLMSDTRSPAPALSNPWGITKALLTHPSTQTAKRWNFQTPRTQPRVEADRVARLSDRRLVAVHGPDAARFLNGITTNFVPEPVASSAVAGSRSAGAAPVAASTPMPQSNGEDFEDVQGGRTADPPSAGPASTPPQGRIRGAHDGFYSAFLNAQGRVLFDVFIFPCGQSAEYWESVPEALGRKYGAGRPVSSHETGEGIGERKDEGKVPAFLIDVDATQFNELLRHLKRYKLRSRCDIRAMDEEWSVLALWNSSTSTSTSLQTFSLSTDILNANLISIPHDPRNPHLGTRLILPPSPSSSSSSSSTTPQNLTPNSSLTEYTHHRHFLSIPQGPTEITPATALPHEYNIDLMGGIDFRKGCYVGQELVVRTQHRGVVRKRVLPVRLYRGGDAAPASLLHDPAGVQKPEKQGEMSLAAVVQRWTNEDGEAPDFVPKDRRGRPAGRWIAGDASGGDMGIALCRVEMMTDLVVSSEAGSPRWVEGDEFVLRRRRKASDESQTSQAKEEGLSEAEAKGREGKDVTRQEKGDGQVGEREEDMGICVKAFVPDWIRRGIRVR